MSSSPSTSKTRAPEDGACDDGGVGPSPVGLLRGWRGGWGQAPLPPVRRCVLCSPRVLCAVLSCGVSPCHSLCVCSLSAAVFSFVCVAVTLAWLWLGCGLALLCLFPCVIVVVVVVIVATTAAARLGRRSQPLAAAVIVATFLVETKAMTMVTVDGAVAVESERASEACKLFVD